jgi:hypothetical protein
MKYPINFKYIEKEFSTSFKKEEKYGTKMVD